MTDRERNRYDALKRVKKFRADHAADFPAAGSPSNVKATALFGTIEAAVANVDDAIEGRTTAMAQFHGGTATETVKRNALMLDLAELNRTAASIAEADGDPGLMDFFHPPWGASDAELPGQARSMIAKAATLAARFVELEYPANFAALLEARVVEFETAGDVQEAGLAQQAGFTGSFEVLLAPGLTALKQLDGLCRRRFRTDAVKLGAWMSASHIERQDGSGGGATPPPPPPPPEVPGAPQNVAQAVGAGGSGELGLNSDGSSGEVDGYKLVVEGVVVGTAATPPVMGIFTPGETVAMTLVAFNEGGDSPPSDTITATAP